MPQNSNSNTPCLVLFRVIRGLFLGRKIGPTKHTNNTKTVELTRRREGNSAIRNPQSEILWLPIYRLCLRTRWATLKVHENTSCLRFHSSGFDRGSCAECGCLKPWDYLLAQIQLDFLRRVSTDRVAREHNLYSWQLFYKCVFRGHTSKGHGGRGDFVS